jgi:hypothetical protein
VVSSAKNMKCILRRLWFMMDILGMRCIYVIRCMSCKIRPKGWKLLGGNKHFSGIMSGLFILRCGMK